jgi:hypothetical protein
MATAFINMYKCTYVKTANEKHLAQKKKTRETYWNYISDIITPVDSTNERPNPKKCCTFLKSIRKESNGVPILKAFGETVNEIEDKTNLYHSIY